MRALRQLQRRHRADSPGGRGLRRLPGIRPRPSTVQLVPTPPALIPIPVGVDKHPLAVHLALGPGSLAPRAIGPLHSALAVFTAPLPLPAIPATIRPCLHPLSASVPVDIGSDIAVSLYRYQVPLSVSLSLVKCPLVLVAYKCSAPDTSICIRAYVCVRMCVCARARACISPLHACQGIAGLKSPLPKRMVPQPRKSPFSKEPL